MWCGVVEYGGWVVVGVMWCCGLLRVRCGGWVDCCRCGVV